MRNLIGETGYAYVVKLSCGIHRITSVKEIAIVRPKKRKRKQNPSLKQPFLSVGQLQHASSS